LGVGKEFKINLNQNLWVLVVSYSALGMAEHWNLKALFWLALFASIGLTVSPLITTWFYTADYCKKRQP
jgi:hypothetical protein